MFPERNLGDYIAGFVDGEGCFSLTFRKDVRHERPGSPVYYNWKAMFVIVLHKDDAAILKLIQEFLGCGSITYAATGAARYQVSNLDDLEAVIVPFFDRHQILGKKGRDFDLWKESVRILHDRKHGSEVGNMNPRLEELQAQMRVIKSKGTKGMSARVSAQAPL